MRLLIVEDEVRLADYLCKGLSENGYVVDVAHDGIDGRHLATEGRYDLLLLDVMLPGLDGFALLDAVRRTSRVPVLMLTARDKVEDRVRGLQGGADDYLVKPFAFSELLARVQALLRRGGQQADAGPANRLQLGELELDLARRKAQRAQQRLDLTAKEFTLLTLLLQRQGQVLSRTLLAEQVWDMNFDSNTNVVEVAVRRLRSKLDDPFDTKLLHTVRGMGYVLEQRVNLRRSIAARLVLALALIAVTVIGLAGAVLHWSLERELMRAEFEEVQGRIELVRRLLDERGGAGVDDEFRRRLERLLTDHGNLLVWVHGADGRLLLGSDALPPPSAATASPSMLRLADGRVTPGCEVQLAEPGPAEGVRITVAIAHSMRAGVLRGYRATLAWIGLLGIGTTIALAAWAAWRGLRPVRALAAQAARITPESLSLRLGGEGVATELQGLSGSFNLALDRLEQAYARLEAFNADVAHELRTPLATLIGGIEVTLAAQRPREELEQLLASHLELLRRLAAIVADMLFLARADSGEQAADRCEVSLADEARKVLDYYDGLIDERGVGVALHGDARVRCNPGLVRRALSNLLSNALKHSSAGTPIEIVIEHGAGRARVAVHNRGITIAPQALPRLFDRFYRGDPARGAGTDSFGLGLAIVRAVALMHGGGVDARSERGRTEVGFSLAG